MKNAANVEAAPLRALHANKAKPKRGRFRAPLRVVAGKGEENQMGWLKPWRWILKALDVLLAGELVRHVGPNDRPLRRHEWENRDYNRPV